MIRVRALVVVIAGAAACAEAGGKATGGELTEAGAQAATPPVFTGGAVDASGTCGTGEGSTFTDLYRDIFASTQPGGCAYQVSCHGPGGDGAQDNAGLQCYPDAHSCRQSLLDRNLIVPKDATGGVLFAPIGGILRTPKEHSATNQMPKQPASYVMPQSCVDRIQAWIAAGAPDN